MVWFRSNIKCVSRLALFALAIQFTLSFGHFHALPPSSPSRHPSASASPESSHLERFFDQVVVDSTTQPPASDRSSDDHPGDICAICLVMAMANSILFAAPPVLLLPQAFEYSYLAPDTDLVRANAAHTGFQPRAPPIS